MKFTLMPCLGAVLFVISWLIPNHYAPWFSFLNEACMAIGLGLIGSHVVAAERRGVELPNVTVGFLFLAALPILQVFGGMIPYAGTGLMAALYISGFALCIAVGHRIFSCQAEDKLAVGCALVLISALISVVLAIYQWLGLRFMADWVAPFAQGSRVYSNIAQPNHLATLLVWGGLANLYLFHQKRLGGYFSVLFCVMLLVGISATQSRAGLLEGVFFLLFYWRMKARVNMPIRLRWLAVGVVLMIVLAFNWPVIDQIFGRGALDYTGSGQAGRLAAGTRPQHWRMLWDAIWLHPILGWGWDQVSFAHMSMALHHPSGPETQAHSHNIFLDLIIWNGLPIGLLVISMFGVWLKNRFKSCGTMESFLLLSAIGVLLTHALVEYPIEYTYFLLPAGVMLGGVVALSPGRARVVTISRFQFSFVLGLMLVLVAIVIHDYLAVESKYRQLRLKAGGFAEGAVTEEKAPIYLLSNLDALLKVVETVPTASMQPDELVRMKNVVQRYTYPFLLAKYAVAAGINNQQDEARAVLQILCNRYGKSVCLHHMTVWVNVTKNQYPQLASVPMPVVPQWGGRSQ